MPERVKFLKCGRVRGKQVAAICKDREDGTKNKSFVAPAGEAFASCTELSD